MTSTYRHYEAQCKNKVRYETRKEAKVHAKWFRRYKREPRRFQVYQCPHCGMYHFGKSIGRDENNH